ncbi:MAG: hypothetical protein IPN92_10130 [Chromatiaceae bacterium]|nr:hypothetical protein [Chromatiaceae bacterium]
MTTATSPLDKPLCLLDVVNELDELLPQLEFCAHGIAKTEIGTGTGACYILLGIYDRLKGLRAAAYLSVRNGRDEEPRHV